MTRSVSDIQQRMRLIRLAHSDPDENAKEFAARVKIQYTTWNMWENGQRIGLDAAILVTDKFPGITLDYIYKGDTGGMPYEVKRRLDFAAEELSESVETTTSEGRPSGRSGSTKSSSSSRQRSKTRRA